MAYAYCRRCGEEAAMNAPTLDEVRFNSWNCPRCDLNHELSPDDRIERLCVEVDELKEQMRQVIDGVATRLRKLENPPLVGRIAGRVDRIPGR